LVKEDQRKREISKSFMDMPMPGGSSETLLELLEEVDTDDASAVSTSGGIKLRALPNMGEEEKPDETATGEASPEPTNGYTQQAIPK